MKKILLALTVLTVTVFTSYCQTTSSSSSSGKFSIGVDVAAPTGTAGDVYSFGIGGSLKYEIPLSSDAYVTLSAGYESFSVKSALVALGASSSSGFIPLKAGLKFYFAGDGTGEGFFGEAQAGVAISTVSGGGSAFAYSPGIGYSMSGGFEAGVRYEAWSKNGTIGQVALRVAYRF